MSPARKRAGEAARAAARDRRPSGAPIRFDDVEPLTVVLVRHGQTDATVERAYSGSSVPGPPLSEEGRRQAAGAAALVGRIGQDLWPDLPRVGSVVTSPMVRTRQTADAVATWLGVDVVEDRDVREADFGAWEGLVADQIEAGWPGMVRRWHTQADFRAPGGESRTDVADRLRAATTRLLAGGTDRSVAVISHVIAIRAALGLATDLDVARWTQYRISPGSVSVIRLWPDGRGEVGAVNLPPL